MAKDKLKAALENKGPSALRSAGAGRVAVTPVNIIAAASPTQAPAEEKPPVVEKTDGKEEQEKRSEIPNDKEGQKRPSKIAKSKEVRNNSDKKRSTKPRIHSERDIQAILALDKRATERYSFEIYSDQKQDIALLCEQYEKQTGHKLSASRFLREVLDYFLPGALKAFENSDEENT
jgi:hypothetical protein